MASIVVLLQPPLRSDSNKTLSTNLYTCKLAKPAAYTLSVTLDPLHDRGGKGNHQTYSWSASLQHACPSSEAGHSTY